MNNDKTKKFGRRDLLKTATAGAGALAASAFLPKKWVKPLVDLGVSPVHAQASFLTGTISGVVTINSTTPVQGSVVTVRDFPALTATSAQDGSYTITNVPVGTHVVDCLPPTGQPQYSPSLLSQTNVVVTSGATTTVNFNFGYLPGTITGFVMVNSTPLDAKAAISGATPVPGAVITIQGFPALTATSAQDGSYTITNVPVGTYIVNCVPPTGQPYSPSQLSQSNVAVTSNATTTVNFEFGYLPGTITGFVTVSTAAQANAAVSGGTAVAGAVITLRGFPALTATSAQDGSYTITNIPVGSYVVDCVPPTGQPQYSPSLLTLPNVVVNSNSSTTADFQFTLLTGSIAGFVSVFTEVSLPGAVITVREQPTWTATSGQDGTYLIPDITIGTYTVDCVPPSGQTPYDPALLTQTNVVVTNGGIGIADFNFDLILG